MHCFVVRCFCLLIKHYFVLCPLTAEEEGMAQMQVSQGDCVWEIGRLTPCLPDPEEDLEK